jgi:hypothetical protein
VEHPVVDAVAHAGTPPAQMDPMAAVRIANDLAYEIGSAPVPGIPGEPVDEDLVERLGMTARLPRWRELAAEELARSAT